jgi:succinate dehydrogenase / fumarate reductase, cytochrome b subunit
MNTLTQTLGTARPASVLLKVGMAVTGFLMAGWLTLHMLALMMVFAGPELMNGYGLKLRETGLLWPMRLFLVAALGVHVACAVWTSRQAWAARPTRYKVALRSRATTLAARSMRVSGGLLLAYVAYHVAQIYGVAHPDYIAGDVHHNLLHILARPLQALLYVAAAALVSLHLAHGLGSALISLGIVARKRARLVRRSLEAWAALVTLGFATVALAPLLGLV